MGNKTRLAGLGYLALALFVWLRFYFYQINPDGVSLASMSEKYAQGHFLGAVNGYWGPLLPWLAVPLVVLGMPSWVALKCVCVMAGLGLLWGLRALLGKLSVQSWVAEALVAGSVIPVVRFASTVIAADLVLFVLLSFYLLLTLEKSDRWDFAWGIRVGVVAGLAYLAKAYALAFVLAHLGCLAAVRLVTARSKNSRRAVAVGALSALLVLGAVVAAWGSVLTHKYGHPTIGTTAVINHRVVGPDSRGHAMFWAGFIAPPDELSVSAWDDPTDLPENPAWSQLGSIRELRHQARLLQTNLSATVAVMETFHPLWALILGLGVVWLLRGRREFGFLIFSACLYSAGYQLLITDERYLWLDWLALVLLAGLLLSELPLRRRWARGLVLAVAAGFSVLPAARLVQERQPNKLMHEIAGAVMAPPGARWASDTNFNDTLLLAYHSRGRYYGQMPDRPAPVASPSEVRRLLDREAIDYYVVWDSSRADLSGDAANGWGEVLKGRYHGLKIYSRLRKYGALSKQRIWRSQS